MKPLKKEKKLQTIAVFQQKGSGESKIRGILAYGKNRFCVEKYNIDSPLPDIIDDASDILPTSIEADLVLDYLKHPDVSHDLWELCDRLNIPVVSSGKNIQGRWVITPRT